VQAVTDRQLEVLTLRRTGLSFRAIGLQLGIAGPVVYDHYMKAMGKVAHAQADEIRRVEGAKLQDLWDVAYDLAMDGKRDTMDRLRGLDRCVRISERYASLFGLDMPKRIDLTSGGQSIDPELARKAAEFDRLSPAEMMEVIQARLQGALPPPLRDVPAPPAWEEAPAPADPTPLLLPAPTGPAPGGEPPPSTPGG
jgi:hypothetical protein